MNEPWLQDAMVEAKVSEAEEPFNHEWDEEEKAEYAIRRYKIYEWAAITHSNAGYREMYADYALALRRAANELLDNTS